MALVAVPVLALLITRALDLPRATQIGIVLMAIAPGAPVALRRSLAAGAHAAFAPGLQISVALLAVISMPLSIAALNEVYAQLLPLGLGIALRHLGAAPPAITATVLAFVLVSLLAITPYAAWRHRTARRAAAYGSPPGPAAR